MDTLLDLMTGDERSQFMKMTRFHRFAKGEIVFREGDLGESLHFVVAGLFVARVVSNLGSELAINTFQPGQFFGEMALLSPTSRRNATVLAVGVSETRAMHRSDFDQLRDSNPRVDRFLVSVFAERTRLLTEQVAELIFTPTHKRVHRVLLRLARESIGTDEAGWIRLGQHELATLAGTTRATVNRAMRDAGRIGALETARGKSRILDVALLETLAR